MSNVAKTIIKRSFKIIKEDGINGFLKAAKEHKNAYPPMRKDLYYWVRSKTSWCKTFEKNINGYWMLLNFNDFGLSKQLYFYGIREPECTKIMEQYLEPGMIVIDIGANIGYYALMEASMGCRVYAIEPLPSNYELLKANIAINKFSMVSYNIAIGDKTKKEKLYLCKQHNRCNMLEGEDYVEIETTTLDDFLKSREQPNLIRMDIEGYEYYAVDGMKETLKNCKNCVLFVELHPYLMEKKGLDWKKPLNIFLESGFKPTFIVKEYGPLKEKAYEYDGSDIYKFLEEKEVTPPDTHGFGLFMVKE